MRVSETPYIETERIEKRVAVLASAIDTMAGDTKLLLLTVLDGAVPFSKLLRSKLTCSYESGTVRAKSYAGTMSGGEVEIPIHYDGPLQGRKILIVEDIVDTGRTADALIRVLEQEGPAWVRMVSLLDKPARRVVAYRPALTGFRIQDRFVVGFGMDYDGKYRELPDIRILEP